MELYRNVLEGEGKEVERPVLMTLAKMAEGSPRQALVLLEQVINLEPEERAKAVKEIKVGERQVVELCRALIAGKSWKKILEILKEIDQDPEAVRRQVLGYANAVLLNGNDKTAPDLIYRFKANFYDSGKAGLVLACYDFCTTRIED
jgi:DNA polymerase III gamma/tau subunit